MPELQLLTRRDRRVAMLAAGVASLSVAAATLLAFSTDGDSEWFLAGSALARAAQRCDKAASASERHQCLRQVAQAQWATDAAPVRLAKH